MNSDLSLEEASKRLEIAFKDTENRLDIIGEKVDSALIDSQKATGTSIISIYKFCRLITTKYLQHRICKCYNSSSI